MNLINLANVVSRTKDLLALVEPMKINSPRLRHVTKTKQVAVARACTFVPIFDPVPFSFNSVDTSRVVSPSRLNVRWNWCIDNGPTQAEGSRGGMRANVSRITEATLQHLPQGMPHRSRSPETLRMLLAVRACARVCAYNHSNHALYISSRPWGWEKAGWNEGAAKEGSPIVKVPRGRKASTRPALLRAKW